jgi:hypothetical protein
LLRGLLAGSGACCINCCWPSVILSPCCPVETSAVPFACSNAPLHLAHPPFPAPCFLQVIAKAKVPIVKFEDADTGYSFDISFDVANGPEVGGWVGGRVGGPLP